MIYEKNGLTVNTIRHCVYKAIIALFLLAASNSFLYPRLIIEKDRDFILSTPDTPTSLQIFRQIGPLKVKESGFTVITDESRVRSIIKDNTVYLYSVSITNEGETAVIIKKDGELVSNVFSIVVPEADSDKDGYPDAAELGNDRPFREWFCAVAESQFYYPSDAWYDVHKDCGGLIEFSYREALKRHDKAWARQYKFLSDFSIPDERKYYYPTVPLLGTKIFRIKEGPFKKGSISGDFSGTAAGSSLRNYSMIFRGKDITMLEKGDVLFFFHEDNLKMPSHAMIYTGPGRSDVREGYLIYHTGPDKKTKGIIKKVLMKDLLRHPDPSWRPLAENTSFLGIYTWKILK